VCFVLKEEEEEEEEDEGEEELSKDAFLLASSYSYDSLIDLLLSLLSSLTRRFLPERSALQFNKYDGRIVAQELSGQVCARQGSGVDQWVA